MPKKLLKIFAFAIGFLVAAPAAFAQTTTYYFSPNFEKEISQGQTTITKYYPLPGGVIAMRRGNELFYLHADHLTSTRLVTSDEGRVMSQFDYYPYGQFVNSQPAIRNSKIEKLYTSQILDSSTDLYFYNARQYNPKTASFISADQAQGPNRYAYVGGNPINKNDPSGNYPPEEVIIPSASPLKTPRTPLKIINKTLVFQSSGIPEFKKYRPITLVITVNLENPILKETLAKIEKDLDKIPEDKLGAEIEKRIISNLPYYSGWMKGDLNKYLNAPSDMGERIAQGLTTSIDYIVLAHLVLGRQGIESEIVIPKTTLAKKAGFIAPSLRVKIGEKTIIYEHTPLITQIYEEPPNMQYLFRFSFFSPYRLPIILKDVSFNHKSQSYW